MRRIGARNAKPGAVLGWPVYDTSGHVIIEAGEELDEDGLTRLEVYGIGELVIEDSRVDDVPVEPLIPPAEEAMCVQGLRQLLLEAEETGTLEDELIEQIEQPIKAIAAGLEGSILGEPSAVGCQTPDQYDYIHPARVAGLSMVIGNHAGLDDKQVSRLGIAALLMNVGYARLPAGILSTPGPLSAESWQAVTAHPGMGGEMIASSRLGSGDIALAVAQSHERWDGTGYPAALSGDGISRPARIIGIVDTYYALVSQRPHRPPFPSHETIEFIMAFNGELFDPELVDIFVSRVPLYPTGVMVRLNTNERGIVSDANLGLVGRPVVRLCVDHLGKQVKRPYDVDLAASEYRGSLVVQVLDY